MNRTVFHTDAINWLSEHPKNNPGISVITSIPDVSEIGKNFDQWQDFFAQAAKLSIQLCEGNGLLILLQTDIRINGQWIDKTAIASQAIQKVGALILAKKIICAKPPGSTSNKRCSFMTMSVFGFTPLNHQIPDIIPDIILDPGPTTWIRGVGTNTALLSVDFIRRFSPSTHTIIDPFCGEGMILAAANQKNFHAIGVELNRKRCEKAKSYIL